MGNKWKHLEGQYLFSPLTMSKYPNLFSYQLVDKLNTIFLHIYTLNIS